MYKDIVVCVNEAEGRDNTIRAAAKFANSLNAKLKGVYVTVNGITLPSFGLSPYGMISNDIIKLAEECEAEQTLNAKQNFQAIVNELDCNASWSEIASYDHPLAVMAYADLIITNQVAYDSRQGCSNIGFINSLILETGKPVILIPTCWDQGQIGKRIVIGWDQSREATRAVQDAMPLLKLADHVDAVTVNHEESDQELVSLSEISNYLARRNVVNDFHSMTTDDHYDTPDKILMGFANKKSADLIVVGGYGHTRLREIILGGSTRNLSKSSDVPVLFSH